jgi:hypothetical protein
MSVSRGTTATQSGVQTSRIFPSGLRGCPARGEVSRMHRCWTPSSVVQGQWPPDTHCGADNEILEQLDIVGRGSSAERE